MINRTVEQIAERIRQSPGIEDAKKSELLALLDTLKDEIADLPSSEDASAESLRRFMELSAHEATRTDRNPNLLEPALQGLAESVKAFESSHPRLAETVNAVCQMLSNLGI